MEKYDARLIYWNLLVFCSYHISQSKKLIENNQISNNFIAGWNRGYSKWTASTTEQEQTSPVQARQVPFEYMNPSEHLVQTPLFWSHYLQ